MHDDNPSAGSDSVNTIEETPSPESVVERYRPLALTIVRALSRHSALAGVETEDLLQEACAALVELTREYAPERCSSFGSYLKQKLKWRLANFLRKEMRRTKRTVEIDESTLEHLVEETKELPSAGVLNPRLRAALRQLSPKQKSVLYEIYWREKTTQELARQLGVSPQNVTALRRRAEDRIRRDMGE